jgi:hypothetical protein
VAKSLDTDRYDIVVRHGSISDLTALRIELVDTRNRVLSQLDMDRADELDERGELVAGGVDIETAAIKAQSETDQNWRARAHAVVRIIDTWLLKVKTRLKELSPHDDYRRNFGAIKIAGAGATADRVVDAINTIVGRGSKVLSWSTHGNDLVVLASVPPEAA